ncbi:hypothetical protein MMC13_005556 [Lambiella insularis]|nr:hypothetical protein [Lambiella insularis]
MDPLSISASVITVTSTIGAAVKGVRKLVGLRKAASKELSVLLDLLVDLHGVLHNVGSVLEYRRQNDIRDGTSYESLGRLAERAKEKVSELNRIIHYELLVTQDRTPGFDLDVHKTGWLRRRAIISTIQQELREIRWDLVIDLQASTALTSYRTLQLMERFDNRLEHIEQQQSIRLIREEQRTIPSKLHEDDTMVPIDLPLVSQAVLNPKEPPTADSTKHINVMPPGSRRSHSKAGYSEHCYCQCHATTRIRSPNALKSLIGSFYLSLPGCSINCQLCSCLTQGYKSPALQMAYAFSPWFIARVVHMRIEGPKLTLSFPRPINAGTPIFHYIEINDIQGVQDLFRARLVTKYDVEGITGRSLLHFAVEHAQYEMCNFLLGIGLDPQHEDLNCRSALGVIIDRSVCGHDSRWMELWKRFMDDDFKADWRFSPLHRLVYNLWDNKSQPRGHASQSMERIGELLENEESKRYLDEVDLFGKTALYWAVLRNNLDLAKLLLQHGADPYRSRYISSPLHVALGNTGNLEMSKTLIEHGAHAESVNHLGKTTLMLASMSRCDPRFLECLLDRGATVNASDIYGKTPLMYATDFDCWANVEILLRRGANINQMSNYGTTALFSAIEFNSHGSLGVLLKHRSDHKHWTSEIGNILYWAACHGDVKTINILTEASLTGIDVDALLDGWSAWDMLYTRIDLSPELEDAFGRLYDSMCPRPLVDDVEKDEIEDNESMDVITDTENRVDEDSFEDAVEALTTDAI